MLPITGISSIIPLPIPILIFNKVRKKAKIRNLFSPPRYRGLVCSLLLWHFLVIRTYSLGEMSLFSYYEPIQRAALFTIIQKGKTEPAYGNLIHIFLREAKTETFLRKCVAQSVLHCSRTIGKDGDECAYRIGTCACTLMQ